MFRKLLIPAAAALALLAGSGAASAKTYLDFNIGIGTPYYGGGYASPYHGDRYYGHRPYYGRYGYRPFVRPCDPVVVGYRKIWSERRHRWIRKPITRCY
ncbi:MAG: hypothetical protein NWR47_00520 [Aestuariivirgaceae bacterium]|nr:hypothetical protein [Aestuariivirgaceae bacterium]